MERSIFSRSVFPVPHTFYHFSPLKLTYPSSINANRFFLIKSSLPSSPLLQPTISNPKKKKEKKKSKSNPKPFFLLYEKNPHVIHKEIQRLARHGNLKQALEIMDHLEYLGVPVNITTFSSLIIACIRLKSADHARMIHARMQANGLGSNEFLRIKIVQLYASCGCFEDAEEELFDICSCSGVGADTVYQWNALLRGIVVSGKRRSEDVISICMKMRVLGVELNEYSFSCLIKALAGAKEFREGLVSHGLLVKNGWIDSSVLKTGLIDLYFKCRKVKLARLVFNDMGNRDIVAWGAMIAGLVHSGFSEEALDYVRCMITEGFAPNSVLLTTILPAVGELGARKIGKEIHAYVVKIGSYSEQVFTQSALIDMYSKCNDLSSARKAFSKFKKRNAVIWTALMSGYISNGRPEQALRLMTWMQQEGLRPDVVTLATVLPVCAELRAEMQGKEIHGYIVRNHILPNTSLSTSLMVMYSKCGKLDYCRGLFDGMVHRNVISWTVLISSLAEHGLLGEALDVFRSMLLRGPKPDAVVVSKVLSICSQLELLKHGKEIHGYVLKRNLERVPFLSVSVIDMYRRCNEVEKARLVESVGSDGGKSGCHFVASAG